MKTFDGWSSIKNLYVLVWFEMNMPKSGVEMDTVEKIGLPLSQY